MITAILIVFLTFLLFLYGIVTQRRPGNFPPGPKWWPFVGNGLMLKKITANLKGHHNAFDQLSKEYKSPVLGLRLGKDYVVVACSPDAVREVLSRDEFLGRPNTYFIQLRCFGKRQGITCVDGPLWHSQRSFVLRHLRDFGFGKSTMEDLINNEVRDLIEILKNEKKPMRISELVTPSILNVLWAFVAGKSLKRTDKQLVRLLDLINVRGRAFDMAGGFLAQFPWLRFIAPEKTGYKLVTELNSEFQQFFTDTIEEHKKTYNPDTTRDLIDAFLHEMYSETNDGTFTESQLTVVLLDLFIAGSQTTSITLDFCFLHMLRYPEVQEKVRNCLRDTVGEKELPVLADKSRLPYVEAVIAEVQRVGNVVPISGPRRCLKDTELGGYFVPKDAMILISLWGMHNDPSTFSNPSSFSPERFLDSDGTFIRDNNLMPFGLGKRRCPGESLAKACVFLIFSGLLTHFKVSKPETDPEPSLVPIAGLTLAPQKYRVDFTSV